MPYLKAATDAAFGLAPYTAPLRITTYVKGATTNIFAGDLVTLLSTGLVTSLADPTIARLLVGVAAETTVSASAGTSVMVYDHPDQLFVVQDDSVGTAIAQTHVGNVFQVTGLTPGTAAQVARGRSITQMDTSTTAATAVAESVLQFIKLHEIESPTFPATAALPRKCVVKILAGNHLYATQSGAI